jgi:hypothetical protein
MAPLALGTASLGRLLRPAWLFFLFWLFLRHELEGKLAGSQEFLKLTVVM